MKFHANHQKVIEERKIFHFVFCAIGKHWYVEKLSIYPKSLFIKDST